MAWLPRVQKSLIRWRILPNDVRPPLGPYLLKHLPVVLAIFLITLGLEWLGYFRGRESYALDAWMNLYTARSPATIYLVLIDDEDYENKDLFNATSPLNPKVLQEALEAIQSGSPAVVAVDFDTSAPQFAGRQWPEAVWMRSATAVTKLDEDALEQTYAAGALEQIRLRGFLGGDGRELPPDAEGVGDTRPTSGVSLFLGDEDGLVRRFRYLYHNADSHSPTHASQYSESFPWAIAKAYADWLREHGKANSPVAIRMEQEEKREIHEKTEAIGLNFGASRDRFRRIKLRTLLQAAKQPYWKDNAPLKDAIVLVGGTYSAGRDHYTTPVGPRHGVELVAHAVETCLAKGGIREFQHWKAYAIDLAVGVVLLLVFWRFPGQAAMLGTLIAAGLLALVASFLAFSSFAYWFNFAPMVGGLWLHYVWEKRHAQRELRHELAQLREEVARLKEGGHLTTGERPAH